MKADIQKHKKAIIHSVYVRAITPSRPPASIYYATANELKSGLYKGFGGDILKFEYDTPDLNMLKSLRENVYMFAAAKTFQQTLAMSNELLVDGKLRSYNDFKDVAGTIFDQYNENWLETEYNTAVGMAQNASKWVDIDADKKKFPLLRYVAVMDEHTCEICAPLDNIVAPVDDSFWDANMPLNHFNCECAVEQLEGDEAEPTAEGDISEALKKSNVEKNPLFNMNPGKHKELFLSTGKYKHPYFEVPKQYKELAKNNFNLPIPHADN